MKMKKNLVIIKKKLFRCFYNYYYYYHFASLDPHEEIAITFYTIYCEMPLGFANGMCVLEIAHPNGSPTVRRHKIII